MTWAILATGPSMSRALADSVRSVKTIAVSDAFRLAPWADALVSADRKWWTANPDARQFAGQKYMAMRDLDDQVERVNTSINGINSGLLALHVAVKLGAKRILLLGFDMHGGHFFGPHAEPLSNTTEKRFEVFKRQFAAYRPAGVEILNCTPGSSLNCYPMANLEDVLC